MLKHEDIWAAIDRLAKENGLTASGLARKAGLDPTTFNRSKRITREGKARWPSTESISKILEATGTGLSHFVNLVRPDQAGVQPTVPLASLDDLREGSVFDDQGVPLAPEWDEITLPDISDPKAFAIEISGSDFEPVYRDGDILIVSPAALPRRGDRVVVTTQGGDVLISRLLRQTARRIDLQPLSGAEECSLSADEISSLSRVIWSSQ